MPFSRGQGWTCCSAPPSVPRAACLLVSAVPFLLPGPLRRRLPSLPCRLASRPSPLPFCLLCPVPLRLASSASSLLVPLSPLRSPCPLCRCHVRNPIRVTSVAHHEHEGPTVWILEPLGNFLTIRNSVHASPPTSQETQSDAPETGRCRQVTGPLHSGPLPCL